MTLKPNGVIRLDGFEDTRQWFVEFEIDRNSYPTKENYYSNIINSYGYYIDNNQAFGGINHLFYDREKELWGAYYNGWRWLTFDKETCMLPGYTA